MGFEPKTAFQYLFSRPNNILLMEYFLSRPDDWHGKKEICRDIGVNYSSNKFSENLAILYKAGYVERDFVNPDSDRANMNVKVYRLKKESEVVRAVQNLRNAISAYL